jgi:hypothetical protein
MKKKRRAKPLVTDVIFRKHKDGEVFAIFPGLVGTSTPYDCSCYAHIGQHSCCDPYWCSRVYKLAKPLEYRDLLKELRRIGYRLRIMKRMTQQHLAEREQQIKDI